LGFEIAPSVDFGLAGEQTSFNVGYTFSAKYYDEPRMDRTEHWDYTHTFDAALAHVFSPRVEMFVRDSFAIGQEPDVLRAADFPYTTPQRIDGSNVRNYGSINFNLEATQLLSFNVGYNNGYFNYADDEITFVGPFFSSASTSGLLDRLEHRAVLDSQWRLSSQTVGIFGYTFGLSSYTGDQQILASSAGPVFSEDRNSRSHTIYVGAQHVFGPNLSASLNVGGQLYDYYNDPSQDHEWSPYVLGNVRYAFESRTSANAGFSYSRSAADVAGQNGNNDYVRDTEVALIYGTLTHEIIPHLIGTGKATLQHAKYNGGGVGYDEEKYLYLQLGFDVAYQFTPNLSAHCGYNYDDSDSDIPGRSYNRNRVYLGVNAAY
jgi:hypothetical protein